MTTIGLGHLPSHLPMNDKTAVLFTSPAPYTLEISNSLSEFVEVNTVMSRQQALSALESGVADKVFIIPEQNRRPQAALIKLLRRHSDLQQIPVVVIENSPSDRHREYWSKVGADAVITPDQLSIGTGIASRN